MIKGTKRYYKIVRKIILYYLDSIIDYLNIIREHKQLQLFCNSVNNNTIIIVCDKFTPRIDKIIYGISTLKKYKIVMIYRKSKLIKGFDNENIDKVVIVKSIYKVLWIAKRINPLIFHVFSSWDFDFAYSLIKNNGKIKSKIVFDDYDVFAGMVRVEYLKNKYFGQLQKEKFCLENADGLCCRSLETQYTKKYLNYNYKGKRIFFPEYLWDNPIKKKSFLPERNLLIYIGNISNSIAKLAELIKKINWDFVIYSHLKSKIKILNVHKPLKPKDLIRAISRYEYAIQLPACLLDENKKINTDAKYYYSTAGKIFDYLEAGLKVLISDEEHQKWILKRYNAAIEIEKENPLDDIIKKLSTFAIERNNATDSANADVSQITIKKQIGRLEKFYLSL